MKLRKQYTCPLEITHDIIKGKWKPIILWILKDGEKSLSYLEKNIQGITQKMLLEHLKELHEYDIIGKRNYEGYPLKVDYFLTGRGRKLLQALTIMQSVGDEILHS